MTARELAAALEELAQGEVDAKSWRKAVELVAQATTSAFGVKVNEVALLVRTSDNLRLKFEHPMPLAKGINVFPVSAPSFAGEVLRASRGIVENGFAATKHLSFYERIQAVDQKSKTIQKIMGAPLWIGQFSFAVIEVSRKGETAAEAGPDFTPLDLARLGELCDASAAWLSRLRPKIH
jgi:hypothetical protein